jgi:transcriptional regulator with XRE-family HTH domain
MLRTTSAASSGRSVRRHVSVRQLAEKAGVSNPYRRQIGRGLRKPTADVLSQIAKALRVSAEVLDVQAGTLEPSAVRDAIVTDAAITRC